MVTKLYDRPVISEPEVTTIIPDVHVDNIQAILEPIVKETREKIREKKNKNFNKKDAMKKANVDSLQDEQNQHVRIHEMAAGAGGSRSTTIDSEGGGDADPSSDILMRTPSTTSATVVDLVSTVDGTRDDNDGTQPKGPCVDIA